MPLRNRREMARALEEVMSHAYAQLEEEQRLQADTSLLKTYLVEAHVEDPSHENVRQALVEAFRPGAMGAGLRSEVSEGEERFFYSVNILRQREEEATFYVDASDQRFWVLHTVARSTSADTLLRRAVSNNGRFDFAWLPMQLLEKTTQLGSFRGLGLDYDRRFIPDVDFEAPDAPVEFLKMQLWGNRAGDILRTLRQQGAFRNATTLSKVKIKHWLDRQADEDLFSLDDVKYDGKITARGTSFQSHIGLVSSVYRTYADRVRQLERQFSISYDSHDHGRCRIGGEPISVTFSAPIADLEIFVASLFSTAHPFRLWGVPTRVGEGYFRVAAIDLHVSQRINFEITRTFMRIYLPDGSCGNTITRLYTNLQHYFDSSVEARAGDGGDVFEF